MFITGLYLSSAYGVLAIDRSRYLSLLTDAVARMGRFLDAQLFQTARSCLHISGVAPFEFSVSFLLIECSIAHQRPAPFLHCMIFYDSRHSRYQLHVAAINCT